MKKLMLTICLVALFVGGCATTPTAGQLANEDYGPYPEQYQDIIKNHFMGTLIDPESVRFRFGENPTRGWLAVFTDASTPFEKDFGWKNKFGWRGKVSVNAKNRMGGYTGFKEFTYLIKYGIVIACQEVRYPKHK